jgi:succinyl-diaminopimelate desuccinylase
MIDEILGKLDIAYTRRVLGEMIKINSVIGREEELAIYLKEELEAIGLECEIHDVEPNRPNIYGRLRGESPGRRLNFNGHTDTVPIVEGWDLDPFTPIVREGKMYGLGSCDMKGGIACTLNMLRAVSNSGHALHGELSFSGVIDEEAYGKGAKAMLETDFAGVDAIVLAEPYPGDESKPIPLGITGKILYDIKVKGKAAHGFRPQLGINAVEDAGKILANLNNLEFMDHPDFGIGNYSTLKIEGGYEIYSVIVPARCRFEVNRLIVPGESIQSVLDDMRSLIESLELESEVEVGIKPPRYEAYVMSKEEEIISIFDPIYREVMGKVPLYEYAYGITDANIFTGEGGIPCLHLGPKRGGAHQKNEFVQLDWLPLVSEMFTRIAVDFLRD